MSNLQAPILQMDNIHLFYDTVHALKGVNFNLFRGEIHALVGTHRAGKSSLVKILSGVEQKSSGAILLHGKKIDYITRKTAAQHKIGMIFQDPSTISSMNTIASIYLGNMVGKRQKLITLNKMKREVEYLYEKYNIHIPFKRFLGQNTQSEQHFVEVLQVLMQEPEILILDELSNRFKPSEMEIIYPIIFNFKKIGKSVIYISHNMDETMRLADRVTVLNDGYYMGTEQIKGLDNMRLIKLTHSFTLSRHQLEQENIELYNLKKYNEDILQNIPSGVIILDTKNDVYLINAAAATIFAITDSEEHLESSIEDFFKATDFLEKDVVLEKLNDRKLHTVEKINIGDNKTLRLTIIPFRNADKKFIGTIILIEDITQELNLREYLLRAEKISSIAELAAGVAHEINNPLGIVKNYIDIMKVSDLPEESIQSLGKVEKEIIRITGIVSNLLSFSKSPGFEFKNVDLIAIMNEVIILLTHSLKKKNVPIICNFECKEAFCNGAENKLKQLFINLIINSIEAIEHNGEIQVYIAEDSEAEAYRIEICDNGSGISPEVMRIIFDPFFSTKVDKKNAGLGLAICQHIVEQHGGVISCKSSPGDFTSFTISIPKFRASVAPDS